MVPVYVEYELPPGADPAGTVAFARERIVHGVRSCVPFWPESNSARIYGAEVGNVGEVDQRVIDKADYDGQGPDLLFVWSGNTVRVLDAETRKEISDIHLDYFDNRLAALRKGIRRGRSNTVVIVANSFHQHGNHLSRRKMLRGDAPNLQALYGTPS